MKKVTLYIDLYYGFFCLFFISKNKRTKIYNELNNFRWPFSFFGAGYYSLYDYNESQQTDRCRFFRNMMSYCKRDISDYDWLYYLNVIHRKSMTENEFFIWFNTERLCFLDECIPTLLKIKEEFKNNPQITKKP